MCERRWYIAKSFLDIKIVPKSIGQFKYKNSGVWLEPSSMIRNKHIIIHWIESEKNVGAIIEGEKNPWCAPKKQFSSKRFIGQKASLLAQESET